ncbi:MAG TPA: VWA domain-containing protein [Candidatus Limnocylindrales bacterium]|nr:VWA domain-containing protein [Candidatus Limnocylindrales bacterium]
MKRVFVPLALFILFAFSLAAHGQSQQNAAQGQSQQGGSGQAAIPAIRSTTPEVVLDMVFRDKKGKTIHDIRPEEIHVQEDGVDQNLTSFKLIEGTAPKQPAAVSVNEPLALDPMREIRLVTLVFENLDQEGKRFFRQALKDVLDMAPEQNLYYSILVIDQRLHCIQPFTADHAELLKSIDKSMMWSYVQYANQSAEIKSELKQMLSTGEPQLQSTSGPTGGAPSQAAIQGAVNYRMAKMQYDMLEQADAADRRYQARVTVDALMALVRSQAELPGRKVVLYFNPWLVISETVKEQYDNLVSVANRANVSFYTVDPKGLVTWSQNNMGRDMLSGATGEIRSQQMAGGVGEVSTSQARAMDSAEDSLRANPLLWLRDLAQKTGGATIAETNDWKAPLRTAMDEVRTYYEASYTPHIAVFDGKFRKISVRVDRPGVVVHTRSGYFALPQIKGGQQLSSYEMPLLNALNATSAPVDVTFQAAAERFNDHGPKIEYMVTLEAPLKGMTFEPQPDQKTAAVDAALLAVLKSPNGEIVEKFSKDFAVQVALDKEDAYKAGNLVQTFRTELAPGAYTLEAVVMDRKGNRIGVKKSPLTVPQPSNKLSMSDVVVVRRTDALKDNQMLDAFYFPGGKVVPTLTSTLKGGPGNVLPFYFSVYPDRSLKAAPVLTMSFYKDGQYLGAAQAPLPEAQQDGRIPYIANLPADKFTPGAYEIHMGVTQGSSQVEEKIAFQVE